MNTTATWKQDVSSVTDTWDCKIGPCDHLHISSFSPDSDRYSCQTWRGGFCLSSVVAGREAAMAKAEERLALPIEEFNARVADELFDRLRQIEGELLRLQPNADFLPGYHAGYEAGVADTKRKIEAVLS